MSKLTPYPIEEANAQGTYLNLTMFVTKKCMTLFILVSVPFSAKSVSYSTPLKVTFSNKRSTPIKMYWVNYSQKPVYYHALAPNTQYTQSTYGTHPWIVADGNDAALFFFIPYLTDVQVTIQ